MFIKPEKSSPNAFSMPHLMLIGAHDDLENYKLDFYTTNISDFMTIKLYMFKQGKHYTCIV